MRECLFCSNLTREEVCFCRLPHAHATFWPHEVRRLRLAKRAAAAAYFETSANWAHHLVIFPSEEAEEAA